MEITKTNLIYSFFNQNLFSTAKMNIKLVRDFYRRDPLTQGNQLVHSMLDIIEHTEFINITEASFRVPLFEQGKTDQECDEVIKKVIDYKKYTKDQCDPIKRHIKELCYQSTLQYAQHKYKEDPVAFLEYCKKHEYSENLAESLQLTSFSKIDITDVFNAYSQGAVLSRYDFINNSFAMKKMPNGQLIMVVGAPGAGKSFFAMSEVDNHLKNGLRCHYLALGDLTELDFVIRLISMRLEVPLNEVTINVIRYYNENKHLFSGLDVSIVPSGKVSPQEYFALMRANADKYDVFVVDYDSNFARDDDAMMYLASGDAYDLLTQLSRMGKLVYVLSQPKQFFWNQDRLPKEAAGESSRKQQIVDMIINLGKSHDSGTRCGWLSLVKNRRGQDGVESPYICSSDGNFHTVSEPAYATVRSDRTKRNHTRGEIKLLEAACEDD